MCIQCSETPLTFQSYFWPSILRHGHVTPDLKKYPIGKRICWILSCAISLIANSLHLNSANIISF